MRGFPPHFAELFGEEHERNYGFRAPADEPVELIGLSVIARGMPDRPRLPDCHSARFDPGSRQPTRLVPRISAGWTHR